MSYRESEDLRTKARFVILILVSSGVLTNYLDRAVVGIAVPAMRSELNLDPALMGVIFSAFSWTYFLGCIPSGVILDRFGTRTIFFIAQIGWSVVTVLHAIATSFGFFVGARCLLGIAEAPAIPSCNSAVASWFPRSERARAIGVYTAAEYVGLSFLSPFLFLIASEFGWRALFLVAGGAGLLSACAWYIIYREPFDTHHANKAELDYIQAGGGAARKTVQGSAFEFGSIRLLFRHRQMWGLCLGQFAVNSTLVFFLTWFPTYLATERHMGWVKVGVFAALPYVFGFFGILFAGSLSDWMLKRGVSLNFARKAPVICGLVGASSIVLANWIENDHLVIAILSLSFFAQAMSSSGWAVLPEIAPRGMLGLVGGLFNASANLAGIIIPLAIGFIVQTTGSFVMALSFIGIVAILGAVSWIFVVGDIHRLELDGKDTSTAARQV
ncbi:MFS transporter [Telmatospirillum sp.]|uniref:MFS transporter n=1 Tax=Telmatospirillum sp. TaxID=2079197 RepID=UPI00283BF638|nr:MFS transporter [Telmatospirillum sp.]MDR3438169.1 MFS transporter [Telmatospirillum sp.]